MSSLLGPEDHKALSQSQLQSVGVEFERSWHLSGREGLRKNMLLICIMESAGSIVFDPA